jgi:two-component system phosphate regulon response regulator PhoB
MPAHILAVDGDSAIADLLRLNLTRAGFGVETSLAAESALLVLDDCLPDVLLAEWDLPGQSGLALIRRVRAQPRTRDLPIIMISARSGEHDKIMALESGADDYITKPFGPREVIARIHALLRRRAPQGRGGNACADPIQVAGLRLDPATHRVTAGTRQLTLGRLEFRLLNFLMHHPERVHTRSQLLDQVWGDHVYLDERTVDTHVGRLRSALAASGHHDHIETVRGSGYRFVAWGRSLQSA